MLFLRMSKEAKDKLVGFGSTLVKRIKYRDGWVFAGRSGMTSPFEEVSVPGRCTQSCPLCVSDAFPALVASRLTTLSTNVCPRFL